MLCALVGLPGSGKSTVGRQLARRLHLPFADTDQIIEKRLGCTIREYFEREGEASFRDVEENVIAEVAAQHEGVLATGGGAVLRPGNREQLRKHGQVIYLHSSPEEVFRRVRHDGNRPLLQVQDPLARLKDLYAVRDPLYRQTAHCVVETGRPTVNVLVNVILLQLGLTGTPRVG